jgi:O-antigen ligase
MIKKIFNKIIPIVALFLIAGVFLDSFQTKFTGIVHLSNLVILLLILCRNIFFPAPQQHQKIKIELLLMLLLFFYLSLNANLFCCSEFNVRMLLRLGFAISLFYSFSQIHWKKMFHCSILLLTFLNIFTGIMSIVGMINQNLWLKFWSLFLTEHSLGLQLYEITRGRISATFPVFMTFIISLALLGLKGKIRIFGITGAMSGLLSTLLWGYRSYVISSIFGIIFLFVLIEQIDKYSRRKIPLISKIKKNTLISVLILFISYLAFFKSFTGVNIVDRFLMIYSIDQQATEGRWNFLNNSVALFRQSPLFGVGIGNSRAYQKPLKISLVSPSGKELGKDLFFLPIDPHNIFLEYLSETGIIGILLISALFILFFLYDLSLYKSIRVFLSRNKDDVILPMSLLVISISSWIFLISVQFTSYTKGALYLFFILRGILTASRQKLV